MLSLVRRFLSLAAGYKPVPASLMNYFSQHHSLVRGD